MAVEENALTRAQLATSDPESVMASLADLEAKYGHLDRDGWLRRSIRSERAFVLELNHRYEEALDELRQLTQAFAHDPHGFMANQLAIASVLKNLVITARRSPSLSRRCLYTKASIQQLSSESSLPMPGSSMLRDGI